MHALVVVGHGSQDPEAVSEFLRLVDMCRLEKSATIVEHAFLEVATPGIAEAIDRCVERGADTIIVSPAILLEAGHARNDIPAEIRSARLRHPDLAIHQAPPLGLHPRIVDLCALRIVETQTAEPCPGQETGLLVVGRGSSDAGANREVRRLGSVLAERIGLTDVSACYLDVARPSLPEALEDVARSRLASVIVLPFLLFTGVLEKRVRHLVQEIAIPKGPRLMYAGPLHAHDHLVRAILERAVEAGFR